MWIFPMIWCSVTNIETNTTGVSPRVLYSSLTSIKISTICDLSVIIAAMCFAWSAAYVIGNGDALITSQMFGLIYTVNPHEDVCGARPTWNFTSIHILYLSVSFLAHKMNLSYYNTAEIMLFHAVLPLHFEHLHFCCESSFVELKVLLLLTCYYIIITTTKRK